MSPSYLLGLSFIFLVAIIWSFASILVQHIYRNEDFDSPFVLTYICTSLFVILLPNRIILEFLSQCYRNDENVQVVPWKSGPIQASQYKVIVVTDIEESTSLDEIEQGTSFEIVSDAVGSENIAMIPENFILGHYETMQISMMLAPIWFFSNYFYNLSLQLTSITSSTIIASTGSLFTFFIAVCTKDEQFSWSKGSGVCLCVLGSIITGLNDSGNNQAEDTSDKRAMVGDILGLLSAIGYGAYTVLIRLKCPKDEKHISMQILFGYIGLFNMVILSPIIIYQYLSYRFQQGTSSEAWISLTVLGLLVLKGLFDNVLSDYLWARSIVLTSATVATVGLGLTIPLAFLSDWFISDIIPSTKGVFGALSVLVGFILVNIKSQ